MKKILFGLVAAAGMLFATSCAKDVDGVGAPSGGDATVTFNVGLENVISTRAISDGKMATKLQYAVFDEDGQTVAESDETTISDNGGKLTATVKFTNLVKGQTYNFVFWAQNPSCSAYTVDWNTATVTVNYNGANNDESRDAFFATKKLQVTGSLTEDITLFRPFAQINFGEIAEGDATLPVVTQSSMTVKGGVYKTLKLLDGTVENETAVSFTKAAVPDGELTVGEKKYAYRSMSYILVGAEKTTAEISFDLSDGEEYNFPNTPIQRNYRTNILKTVTTEDVTFNVEVDPSYNGDLPEDEEEEPQPEVKTASVINFDMDLSAEGGHITATYESNGEVTAAEFVFTPAAAGAALTRVEANGVIRIPADEVNDGTATVNVSAEQYARYGFIPGTKYDVTVEFTIDGEKVPAEFTGEVADETPSFDVPEEQGGDDDNKSHEGTAEDPFTVAEAIAKAQADATNDSNTPTAETYYVKGKVSNIKYTFSAEYGTATFEIVDDGADAVFTAYSVYYLENKSWVESNDQIFVGDEVIVAGQFVNYKDTKSETYTPETASKKGYLYQYVSKVERPITVYGLKATVGEGKSVTFTANYTNYSKLSVTKAGFKYGIDNTDTDATVENPDAEFGTITKTVDVADYGKYNVVAYLNDTETAAASFSIKDPNAAGDAAPEVGTVLWSDTFADYGTNSTTFTQNKDISEYDYAGRSGYKDNATNVTLTANNNVKATTSSGTNCTSGHLWFNKSVEGVLTTSEINLYGATSLKVTFDQGTSGSAITTSYSTDGGGKWTDLGTTNAPNPNITYTFVVGNDVKSVMLKFTHPSSNEKNTRFDNPTLTVAE